MVIYSLTPILGKIYCYTLVLGFILSIYLLEKYHQDIRHPDTNVKPMSLSTLIMYLLHRSLWVIFIPLGVYKVVVVQLNKYSYLWDNLSKNYTQLIYMSDPNNNSKEISKVSH